MIMNHKKVARTLFAAILSILGCVAAAADAPVAAGRTYAAGSGALVLRGPWERYAGRLGEAEMAKAPRDLVELSLRPRAPNYGAASSGPASYRMVIRLDGGASPRRMAIYFPAIAGVSAAYVNGGLLYDSDRDPASSPLLLFDAAGPEVSIVLQFSPGARGLESPSSFPSFVLFGGAASVYRARLWIGVAAAFLEAFFVILGLFVLVLFLFWKKNREFLALAAYLLVVGLYYFLENEALFPFLPAGATRGALEAARLVALDLQYLALAFFLHALYRFRVKLAAALPFYALPVALAAAGLALPGSLGYLDLAGEAYFALFGLAALGFFAFLAAKGDKKARRLFPAFLALPAAAAFGRLGPETVVSAYLVESAGAALFGFVALLMLIEKMANTFESTELLTDYVASVSRAVKSFIPGEFLEHLQKEDLVDLRLGDHAKKEMTIFFSDIRAFTQLSEGLTVEENFAFINSYLARVVPIIKENGGFVDKYVGDGIMALFPGPRGPDEAIRSAIAMQSKMVEYNGHRANMGYKPISMGIGVHTGDLMLGVVGVEDRMENTVISDAVNLGSRLQSIAKAFNIGLVISEQAFKELEDPGSYKYRFIGKVKVKGKAAPISVFDIFDGIEGDLFERKMKGKMFFELGMLSYYQ
jgi:adenylate cyclase